MASRDQDLRQSSEQNHGPPRSAFLLAKAPGPRKQPERAEATTPGRLHGAAQLWGMLKTWTLLDHWGKSCIKRRGSGVGGRKPTRRLSTARRPEAGVAVKQVSSLRQAGHLRPSAPPCHLVSCTAQVAWREGGHIHALAVTFQGPAG